MSFFAELKRRNVFKVGVAYAIVAWLLIEVVATVFPLLTLPDWSARFITVVILIGFPIAVFLAWAYELTPEGIKATAEVERSQSITQSTGQRLNYFIIGVLVLVVAFLLVKDYVLKESPEVADKAPGTSLVTEPVSPENAVQEKAEPTALPNSIAVLPFANLSPDPDQEYFADGLTEELLNKLAQVKDLQVTARTSSFHFKGKNEDIRNIGQMLGVAHLLEGSVKKYGNQLRVTAQLVKAEDGYHLWSGTFDRPLADVFAIQDDIAQAVTRALSITLGVGAFNRPGMTNNVNAYEEYLQVLADINLNTPEAALSAIDHAEYAVRLDPEFGLGWLSVRNAHNHAIGWLPPEQTVDFREKMTSARQRADEIDPHMSELQLVMAQDYQLNGNWLEAEKTFKEMLDNYATAEVNESYGLMLLSAGRSRDAIPYLQRAKRLNPLSAAVSSTLAMTHYNLGDMDAAQSEVKRGRTLEGQESTFSLIEWFIALGRNDRPRAIEIITTNFTDPDNPDEIITRLAELMAMDDGDVALNEYRMFLKNYVRNSSLSPISYLQLAHIASELGDAELALKYYQETFINNPSVSLISTALWHPLHRNMRKLTGFKLLVRDVGLVDYWHAAGNWNDYCHPVSESDFECN